jgi:AcrR family transcriptional regulator
MGSRQAVECDESVRQANNCAGTESSASGLSREVVVEAALAFIDQHGLTSLTMRRLGAACGVEAMALYRYVQGRGDLLTGVVDHIVDQLYSDHLVTRNHHHSWQDYLVRLAHGVRQIALDHPQVFPLVASEAPEAPWVRPPLRSLRWMETFLDTLISYGFDDVAAVAAYRTYTASLLGQLLLEILARGAPLHPDQTVLDQASTPGGRDLSDYPHLQRLQVMLAQDHSATEFDTMLESVLTRLEGLVEVQHC